MVKFSPPEDRLIKMREVIQLTSLSRSSIYKKMAQGFPAPIQMSARSRRWWRSDVVAYIASRPRSTIPQTELNRG